MTHARSPRRTRLPVTKSSRLRALLLRGAAAPRPPLCVAPPTTSQAEPQTRAGETLSSLQFCVDATCEPTRRDDGHEPPHASQLRSQPRRKGEREEATQKDAAGTDEAEELRPPDVTFGGILFTEVSARHLHSIGGADVVENLPGVGLCCHEPSATDRRIARRRGRVGRVQCHGWHNTCRTCLGRLQHHSVEECGRCGRHGCQRGAWRPGDQRDGGWYRAARLTGLRSRRCRDDRAE